MRKFPLTELQMSSVALVERAARLSRGLTQMRVRGPGDLDNAMRAIERDYGIDYWITWRLRYRVTQIRDIGASVLLRLEAAYQAECERQRAKLSLELEATRAQVGPDHPAVRAAEAVLGETQATQSNAPGLGEPTQD